MVSDFGYISFFFFCNVNFVGVTFGINQFADMTAQGMKFNIYYEHLTSDVTDAIIQSSSSVC